jgi:hypothetical protein
LVLVGLVAFARSAKAAAWVEATVVSDVVTVAIERDGRATVSHSMAMKIRGGPLKSWTLQGIDRDAEPLPEAAVVNTVAALAQNSRRELVLTRGDDETLQMDIVDDRGLKQGTYLFQFAYRTDFRSAKMLRARGPWLEIGWIGPRFPAGLDGAKVTFRIPAASTSPRLPELDVDPDLPNIEGAPADSFVSTVRRNTSFDEIDLVRAHVALGEPVLWRLWASPAAFDASVLPAPAVNFNHELPLSAAIDANKPGGWSWLASAFSAAILWISALLAKLRLYALDCRRAGVTPRAALRLHPVVRVTLSGFFVAAAILLAYVWQTPTLAALCIAAAALFAAQRSPTDVRELRAPGAWLPLTDADAFSRSDPTLRGRFLDISRWQGRGLLFLWLLAMGLAMFAMARRSSYDAALLGLFLPLPLPLFLTARGTQLPHARQKRAAGWLSKLHHRLTRAHGLKVIAWARFPDGTATPDELRLRVIAPQPVPGLLALEVAYGESMDTHESSATLLLRVVDGTPAQQVGRGQLVWQRGRRADERVAALTLTWPSWALAEDTIVELVAELLSQSDRDTRKPSPRGKLGRCPGKVVTTSKSGVVAVAATARRRAPHPST